MTHPTLNTIGWFGIIPKFAHMLPVDSAILVVVLGSNPLSLANCLKHKEIQ